jgi:hypothetical protein
MDEEERHIEDALNNKDDLPDEEYKDIFLRSVRLNFIGRLFHDREDWKRNMNHLRDFKVLKMPRVMQSIMYLLKFSREDLCEKGTNKFFWKIAKNHFGDEFVGRLMSY